jgi:hypothetical protein
MDHHLPRPAHLQPKRAKVVIINGVEMHLRECSKCGIEFYGSLEHSSCNECGGKKKARRKTA